MIKNSSDSCNDDTEEEDGVDMPEALDDEYSTDLEPTGGDLVQEHIQRPYNAESPMGFDSIPSSTSGESFDEMNFPTQLKPLSSSSGTKCSEESSFHAATCGPNGLRRGTGTNISDNSSGRSAMNLFGEGVFYLPQSPYMTQGTLRDQIIYPKVSPWDESKKASSTGNIFWLDKPVHSSSVTFADHISSDISSTEFDYEGDARSFTAMKPNGSGGVKTNIAKSTSTADLNAAPAIPPPRTNIGRDDSDSLVSDKNYTGALVNEGWKTRRQLKASPGPGEGRRRDSAPRRPPWTTHETSSLRASA